MAVPRRYQNAPGVLCAFASRSIGQGLPRLDYLGKPASLLEQRAV